MTTIGLRYKIAMALFLILPKGLGVCQVPIVTSDSALIASAWNDTTRLREIAIGHNGYPIAAKAQNRLGVIFYSSWRTHDAEVEFLSTHQQYPGTAEAMEAAGYLGKISYWKDKFGMAESYFKEYLAGNPIGGEAQWNRYCLVRAMRQTNDSSFLSTAQRYFLSQHDTTRLRDDLVQYDIVRYLEYNHQYPQAIDAANTLVNRYPASQYIGFAETHIADCYMLSGNPKAAISECETLLGKYPANSVEAARAQNMIATFCVNMKDYARARIEYAKVPKFNPSLTEWVNASKYGLALVDIEEGTAQDDSALLRGAVKSLRAFVKENASDRNVPSALMDIANLLTKDGSPDELIAAYTEVIRFDSTKIDSGRYAGHSDRMKAHRELVSRAHTAKGMLLRIKLHDPIGALSEFEAVLGAHPRLADALLNKAVCLIELNRKPEARLILEGLIKEETEVKEAANQILSSL